VLSDWAPLALVPFLYWELPVLMEVLPGPVRYHDPAIVAVERALFGAQPAYDWAGAMPSIVLSELVHACYLSYYLLIYAPPLLLYLGPMAGPGRSGGSTPAFRETVLGVTLAFLACFVVFIVFPVQGPRYLGVPAGVPDGPVRELVLALLEAGSSRGAAFPSSHVSVAIAQAGLALRHQPRVGRRILPLAIGLAAGAVYGGFHYGIDALAGAAVGVGAAYSAGPLRRRIEGPDAGLTKAL
jgi:membrane-associated phospholipid phosphatase